MHNGVLTKFYEKSHDCEDGPNNVQALSLLDKWM